MAWLSGCVLYVIDGRKSLFHVQGESNMNHVKIERHTRWVGHWRKEAIKWCVVSIVQAVTEEFVL